MLQYKMIKSVSKSLPFETLLFIFIQFICFLMQLWLWHYGAFKRNFEAFSICRKLSNRRIMLSFIVKYLLFIQKAFYFFRICGIIFQTRITRKKGEAKNVYLYCGKKRAETEEGEFSTYGIRCYDLDSGNVAAEIRDVFCDKRLAEQFAEKCSSEMLEPVHLFQPRLRTPSGVQARLFLSDPMRVFSTAVLQCRL